MGKQGERYLHVFESVDWGGKVKVFCVKAHIFSPWCAEYTVPNEFGSCDVCHLCCELAGVIDDVSTSRDLDAVGIFCLWVMVNDYPCIHYHSVLGDIWYVQR